MYNFGDIRSRNPRVYAVNSSTVMHALCLNLADCRTLLTLSVALFRTQTAMTGRVSATYSCTADMHSSVILSPDLAAIASSYSLLYTPLYGNVLFVGVPAVPDDEIYVGRLQS